MIENISMATKAEIQEEMARLDKEYQEKENKLKHQFEEWTRYVKEVDAEVRTLSEQYNRLKNELNKREGKLNNEN